MTREELIERICPTDCLDKCFEGNISCDFCDKITGLMFDEYEKQIRANVIDEFLSKAKEKKYHSDITHENCVAIAELDWIVEQLKE